MRLLAITILTLCVFSAAAQLISVDPVPEPCGTMSQDSINRALYPGWQSLDELEIAIQERIQVMKKTNALGRIEAVVTIPVIFHIH